MGSSYTTLTGAMPSVKKLAWNPWRNQLVADRVAECVFPRTTTFYVSTSGDDGNDGLTPESPIQTTAEVQSRIDAGSGDILFAFRRGDVWATTDPILGDETASAFSAYGTGANPIISAFTLAYSSGWSAVSGGCYSRTEANTVGWVISATDRLHVLTRMLRRVADEASCIATAYSWSQVSTTLFVNLGGTNPNTVALEANIANSESGLTLTGDLSLASDIDLYGWGMNPAATSNQKMGFSIEGGGTNACLGLNVGSFYGSSHCMAQYLGTGAGGIASFIGCRAGGCIYNGSGGETVFNGYAPDGGMQVLWHRCRPLMGTLPSSDWVTGATTVSRGRGFYCHTNGTAIAASGGLVINSRPIFSPRPLQGTSSPNGELGSAYQLNNGGDSTSFDGEDWRVITADPRTTGFMDATELDNSGGVDECIINEDFWVHSRKLSGLNQSGVRGWSINCVKRIDLSRISGSGTVGLWNTIYTSNEAKMYHCVTSWENPPSGVTVAGADVDVFNNASNDGSPAGGTTRNGVAVNCIFQVVNPTGTNRVAFNNNLTGGLSGTGSMSHCSVMGFTDISGYRGFSGITNYEVMARPFIHTEIFNPGLLKTGTDAEIEYDCNWNARSSGNPLRGAYVRVAPPAPFLPYGCWPNQVWYAGHQGYLAEEAIV